MARAFFKSQSAQAHFRVLQMIYEIVFEDTGKRLEFRHLHSPTLDPLDWVGVYLITLDLHVGQALGS